MEGRQGFVARRLVAIAVAPSRVSSDIFQPSEHLCQDAGGNRVPLLDDTANHDRALPFREAVEQPDSVLPAADLPKPAAERPGVRQP